MRDHAAELADHVAVARSVEALLPDLDALGTAVCDSLAAGGRVYTFGNGGSAADAQHLATELIGRYLRNRRPLPAVALTVDPSAVTCIANDFSYDEVFARQVTALAGPRDIVIGFSTSGTSPSVVAGLEAAHAAGATTVLFGGGNGGTARQHADHALLVASTTTARIQEMHLLLLHLLSERIDAWAAGEDGSPVGAGSKASQADDRRLDAT